MYQHYVDLDDGKKRLLLSILGAPLGSVVAVKASLISNGELIEEDELKVSMFQKFQDEFQLMSFLIY